MPTQAESDLNDGINCNVSPRVYFAQSSQIQVSATSHPTCMVPHRHSDVRGRILGGARQELPMMCIDERLPCPRCGHKRVAQEAMYVYVCFQCHNTWSTTRPEVRPVDVLAQFRPNERARLIAYRGAVRYGLYTDWPVAEPERLR